MNSSSRARNPRELESASALEENGFSLLVSRPAGGHVGNYNEITSPRLIYFDQRRAGELLEDVASNLPGRNLLANLAPRIGMDSIGVLEQQNQRAVLSGLLADLVTRIGVDSIGVLQQQNQRAILSETSLEVGAIIDLYQPDDGHQQSSWEEFHPDQAVVIRGAVASAKDVLPSSLQLKGDAISVRVYVERDHFLHLNQRYLVGRPIIAVGKVRSVPRSELRAAAIGTSTERIRLPFSADS